MDLVQNKLYNSLPLCRTIITKYFSNENQNKITPEYYIFICSVSVDLRARYWSIVSEALVMS